MSQGVRHGLAQVVTHQAGRLRKQANAGPYDQGCNETFQSCFKDYFDGTVDLETAKSNFEDQIKVKYPELTSVEWLVPDALTAPQN